MSIEDRLRNAAHAVDEMWTDDKTTQGRFARLEARLSTQAEAAAASSPRLDAVRLIEIGRLVLVNTAVRHAPLEIVAETGQALALASAIGSHLTEHGPPEIADTASHLAELGYAALDRLESTTAVDLRADQLGEVPDVRKALVGLGALLGEVGIALVAVACGTDDDGLYSQCIEATDAADEMSDQIRGMLQSLTVNEQRSTPAAAQPTE
ncbi:DUF6099 family protein [Streptomyces scopuliridis]|uniref:DUF6099 family protein n=1 Tax=Streptomyces scopuliridis TaxID=452529 RepID=UPI00342749B2